MNWRATLKSRYLEEKKDFSSFRRWFFRLPREERFILVMHGIIILILGAAFGITLVFLMDGLIWIFN